MLRSVMIPSRSFLRVALFHALGIGVVLSMAACGAAIDDGATGEPDAGELGDDGDDGNDGDDGDDGGDGDNGDDGDVTPPAELSVTPADGSIGVAAGAVIAIQFSEPMDQESVAGAWLSEKLPATDVVFSWNQASDTLTVTPKKALQLASGADPSEVVAAEYTYSIGVAATDLAGNPLAAPIDVSFATRRRITFDLEPVIDMTRTVRSDGSLSSTYLRTVYVGDDLSNLQVKAFATFSLPKLPGGAEVTTALLSAYQAQMANAPYVLGTVRVHHVSQEKLGTSAFIAPPLSDAGDLSDDPGIGKKTRDVTAQFLDDLANDQARGERTQYRLEFPNATDSDELADQAGFRRYDLSLWVTYLID